MNNRAKRKRIVIRIAKWFVSTVLLLLVLLAALLVFLQTGAGKQLLASALSDVLSGKDHEVVITGIGGHPPFEVSVERIEIRDRDGIWMEIESVSLSWSLWAKSRFMIYLKKIRVASIDWRRVPQPGEQAPEPSPSPRTGMPPVILLDELSIERFFASDDVLGTGVVLSVRGNAALLVEPGKASAAIHVQRADEDADASIGLYIEPGSIALSDLHLALAGLAIQAELSAPSDEGLLDGSFRVSIEDVSRLAQLLGHEASGSLSAQVDLVADGGRQFISGDAAAHDFRFNDFLLSNLEWQARREGHETRSSLKAAGVAGTPWKITCAGACDLTPSTQLFRLDSLEALISDLNVALRAPSSLEISENRTALNGLILDWDGGNLSVDLDLPGTFTLQPFSMSLEQNGEMRIAVSAEADLAVLNILPFFPNQYFGGRFDARLSYEGTMSDGTLAGHCAVVDGMFQHYEYGTVIRDINFDMVTDGQRLVLNEIAASAGDQGKIRAKGEIAFVPAKGFPFDFSLVLDKAQLARNDFLDVTVSGDMSLTGSVNGVALTGVVTVDPAYVYLDKLPARLPGTLDEPQPDARAKEFEDADRDPIPMTADITINIPGGFFIQGQGMDTAWGGELHIADGPDGWIVTGQVSPRRGTFMFLSRQFRFDRGTVTFDGSVPPMPVLDLTALYSRADIIASLKFEGRLNNPEMSLQSQPPLPEDEILARILFGKNMSTITPLQAVQVASAAQSMVSPGGGGFDIMGEARNLLGVDQLEFRESGDTEGKAELVAGKHISNQLYVEVNKALANDESKITAEYEIHPNLSVETYTGSGLRPGIGINWKKDY